MKILYKLLFCFLIFFAIQRFCRSQTQGFNIDKTRADFPHNVKWESSPISPLQEKEVQDILKQPFYFLGSGVQCYAFISEDQKTVLKFFKHYHMWPSSSFLRKTSLPKFLNKVKKSLLSAREKRIQSIFESVKIASTELKEQTATFFVHLNTTNQQFSPLKIFDAIGCVHTINLDETPFILQKKAELIYPKISNDLADKNIEGAKQTLHQLVDIIVTRSKKGISNNDPVVRRNFGYLENQVIEIDIGSFSKNPATYQDYLIKRAIFYETLDLKQWLKSKNDTLYQEFERDLYEQLSYIQTN